MYKHTQIGWVIIYSMAAVMLLFIWSGAVEAPGGGWVLWLFPLLALLFGSLTVRVVPGAVRLSFGIGLFRMTVPLAGAATVEMKRSKWWCGFGIHGWWGKGWLINVSGLEVVVIRMHSGMIYAIGTDEPQKLRDAVTAALAQGGVA